MSGFIKQLLQNPFGSQRCSDCDEPINSSDINITEGVALCPGCGKLSKLLELNTIGRSIDEILTSPPSSCQINPFVQGIVVQVSLRSIPDFLLMAGMMFFWHGITGVFVLTAIAQLYSNLIGPVPKWFPAFVMKDAKPEMNGEPTALGETPFLCVFLILFVTAGIVMASIAIMNLIGRVKVVIDEYDSYVSTGIGWIDWKRRFDPRAVHAVEFQASQWQSEEGSRKMIVLKSDRNLAFGSMLNDEQMAWLRAVLRQILLPQKFPQRSANLPKLPWLTRHSS